MKRSLTLNYHCLGESTRQAMVVLSDDEDIRDQETRERWVKELADQLAYALDHDLKTPGTKFV